MIISHSDIVQFMASNVANDNNLQVEQLSPDYCVVIDISKYASVDVLNKNLLILFNCLNHNGLINTHQVENQKLYENILIRPNNESVYVFFKSINSNHNHVNLSGLESKLNISSVIPLNLIYEDKLIDHLVKKDVYKNKKSLLPDDSTLIEILNLNGNKDVYFYFVFFKKYIKSLFKISILGFILRIISHPYEFNLFFSILLSLNSIWFAVSWIYKDKLFYENKANLVKRTLNYNKSTTNLVSLKTYSKPIIVKKLLFVPVILFFALILLSFQFFCFTIEISLTQLYSCPFSFLKPVLPLIPTVLLAVFVQVLTITYNKYVVDPYVNWENYDNNLTEIKRSKLEKNIIFTFCTNYFPLLLTLFVYIPFGHLVNDGIKVFVGKYLQVTEGEFIIDVKRYQAQLFFFIVTNQIITIVVENVLPISISKLLPKLLGKKDSSKTTKNESMDIIKQHYSDDYRIWNGINKYQKSASIWGEFDLNANYQKVISQFGYIAMFSTIWPLAPLVIILFDVVIFRLDIVRAYKKCKPISKNICVNDVINQKPVGYVKSLWDLVTIFIATFGSVVTLTITYMFRYSKLQVVNNPYQILSVAKREKVLTSNPLNHSSFNIFFMAVVFEHLVVLTYYSIVKIITAEKSVKLHTPVPSYESVRTGNVTPKDVELSTQKKGDGDDFSNKVRNVIENLNDENIVSHSEIINEEPNSKISVDQNLNKNMEALDTVIKMSSIPQAQPGSQILRKNSIVSIKSVKDNNGTRLVLKDLVDSSKSEIAGATVPVRIPTSKNYNLRYDQDGNLMLPIAQEKLSDSGDSKLNKENVAVNGEEILPINEPSKVSESKTPLKTLDPRTANPLESHSQKDLDKKFTVPTENTEAASTISAKQEPKKTTRHSIVSSALNDNHSEASNAISSKKGSRSQKSKSGSHALSTPHRGSSIADSSTSSATDASKKKKKGLFNKLKVKL